MSWREYFAGYVYYTPYVGSEWASAWFELPRWRRFDPSLPDAFNSAAPEPRFLPVFNRLQAVLSKLLMEGSSQDKQLLELAQRLSSVRLGATGVPEYEAFLTTWDELGTSGNVPSCMRLSIDILLQNWIMQLALVPFFAWRGMFIGGCCGEGNQIPYVVISMPPYLSAFTARIYSKLNRWVHRLHVCLLFGLVPVAAMVIFSALRRAEWSVIVFALPMVFLFAFLSALTNFHPRFGIPLMPGLIVLLCTGAAWLAHSS
jgi:hypothetical protein